MHPAMGIITVDTCGTKYFNTLLRPLHHGNNLHTPYGAIRLNLLERYIVFFALL